MLYSVLCKILSIIFYILGLKANGVKNIPQKGSAIIAANHVSNWDPIVVALVINRPIHFIAKAELFNSVLLGKLLYKLHAFPIKRGAGDRRAIRNALKILEEENILGIFPEGARNKVGEDLKAQSGVAMLALKSQVPVVPVACIGTDKKIPFGWFQTLEVRIGTPVLYAEYAEQKVNSAVLEEVSIDIMKKINVLLDK